MIQVELTRPDLEEAWKQAREQAYRTTYRWTFVLTLVSQTLTCDGNVDQGLTEVQYDYVFTCSYY